MTRTSAAEVRKPKLVGRGSRSLRLQAEVVHGTQAYPLIGYVCLISTLPVKEMSKWPLQSPICKHPPNGSHQEPLS